MERGRSASQRCPAPGRDRGTASSRLLRRLQALPCGCGRRSSPGILVSAAAAAPGQARGAHLPGRRAGANPNPCREQELRQQRGAGRRAGGCGGRAPEAAAHLRGHGQGIRRHLRQGDPAMDAQHGGPAAARPGGRGEACGGILQAPAPPPAQPQGPPGGARRRRRRGSRERAWEQQPGAAGGRLRGRAGRVQPRAECAVRLAHPRHPLASIVKERYTLNNGFSKNGNGVACPTPPTTERNAKLLPAHHHNSAWRRLSSCCHQSAHTQAQPPNVYAPAKMDQPLIPSAVSEDSPDVDVDLELNAQPVSRAGPDHDSEMQLPQPACCNFTQILWALFIAVAEVLGFVGTIVPLYLLILDWTAHYVNGTKSSLMLQLLVPFTAVHLLRTQIAILRSSFVKWIALVFVFLYIFLPWPVLNEPIVTVPAGLILFVLVVPPPLKFLMDQGLYACFPCPALLAGWGISSFLLYQQWESHDRDIEQLFSSSVASATTMGIAFLYLVTPIQFLVIVTLGHTNVAHVS